VGLRDIGRTILLSSKAGLVNKRIQPMNLNPSRTQLFLLRQHPGK
jgi:hypothetical protein